MIVHEYGLKFTSCPIMLLKWLRNNNQDELVFQWLGSCIKKNGRAVMLKCDIDISRLTYYVQHVLEEKIKDKY